MYIVIFYFQAYITFHSYGQTFIFPYSYAIKDVDNYDEHVSTFLVIANASYGFKNQILFQVNLLTHFYGRGVYFNNQMLAIRNTHRVLYDELHHFIKNSLQTKPFYNVYHFIKY